MIASGKALASSDRPRSLEVAGVSSTFVLARVLDREFGFESVVMELTDSA